MAITKEQVKETLKKVVDPEVGLNLVDLGLIYDIEVTPENVINIKMTLTTKGCPMHEMMLTSAKRTVQNTLKAKEVNLNLVWEPAWTPERLSSEAKKKLGYT